MNVSEQKALDQNEVKDLSAWGCARRPGICMFDMYSVLLQCFGAN